MVGTIKNNEKHTTNITSFSKISLHFTDPDVKPLTNWRCKNMNATTAGIATRVENAIMVSKLDLYIPINWKTPNETGCISVFGKKDKAKTNSPQAVRKEKTPTATKPALTRGRMMNHNTWIREPPSIHAASSRASGICIKLVSQVSSRGARVLASRERAASGVGCGSRVRSHRMRPVCGSSTTSPHLMKPVQV